MRIVLLRGPSGSGKTTYAHRVLGPSHAHCIVSADDFFTDNKGVYRFMPSLLNDAHKACQLKVKALMLAETPLIFVANTHT
jgi:uridine kinase